MKKIIVAVLIALALCSCTTKANYIKEAQLWGHYCTWEKVSGVKNWPDLQLLKMQVDNPNFIWTDEFVGEVLDYIDKTTHYFPYSHDPILFTPEELMANNFWGNCYDIATSAWCVFKYLDYPYDARLQGVRFWGITNHAMLIIEMPSDKRWVRYQTASFVYLEKVDELFYRTQIEWDSKNYWLPGDLGRPDSPLDHWKYIVTEY